MAQVELDIAGRRYTVACRDGEEAHLSKLGAMVSEKAEEAQRAVGGVNEARQLLFAALLLADDQQSRAVAPEPLDTGLDDALARLAERVEAIAQSLEKADTPA